MKEIKYSDEQIDYWQRNYKYKINDFENKINLIEDRTIRSIFWDQYRLFNQIYLHLSCLASFLQKIEEDLL